MTTRMTGLLATIFALLVWGPNAQAACTAAQFAGTWDVVFSDGNSCRLILDRDGSLLTAPDRSLSTCMDPFLGVTAPDGGGYEVDSSCGAGFVLVVEDQVVEMFGRIAQPRNISAGYYLLYSAADYVPNESSPFAKGAFTMIRAE